MITLPLSIHAHAHSFAQRVYHADAHPVQSTRDLVSPLPSVVVEFTPGVKDSQYRLQCRYSRGRVDVGGYTAAVVDYRAGTVGIDGGGDDGGVSGEGFVDAVIDDLPDEVMETVGSRGPDVHSRPLPHRLQPFQHRDLTRPVLAPSRCGDDLLRGGGLERGGGGGVEEGAPTRVRPRRKRRRWDGYSGRRPSATCARARPRTSGREGRTSARGVPCRRCRRPGTEKEGDDGADARGRPRRRRAWRPARTHRRKREPARTQPPPTIDSDRLIPALFGAISTRLLSEDVRVEGRGTLSMRTADPMRTRGERRQMRDNN
mmetsp:Transcript_63227/g.186930  ORF Transcript_63227/g.186930 Transcript_63227/m.186930 type:complete len:316 (-) Transcript_63227:90-1037(-)